MDADTTPERSHTDCRAGLIIFGIIEILVGAICALMVPLMIVGIVAGAAAGNVEGMDPRMMIPGILFYLIIAVWFTWLGIGSAMCRRWARSILLVTSWLALAFGVIGVANWFYIAPRIYAAIAEQQGGITESMIGVMRAVTTAFMFVIYIIGPSAMVIFYGNRHVRATCETRDPRERWTDRCPPQVMALSYMFLLWGVSLLSMFAYKCAVPFFGSVLTGAPGAAVTTVAAALSLWIAWGLYKLRQGAWWGAVTLTLVFFGSAAVTFARVPLMKYYEYMDFPAEQLELIRAMNIDKDPVIAIFIVVWVLAFVGYLVYTRRYFPGSVAADQSFQSRGTPC